MVTVRIYSSHQHSNLCIACLFPASNPKTQGEVVARICAHRASINSGLVDDKAWPRGYLQTNPRREQGEQITRSGLGREVGRYLKNPRTQSVHAVVLRACMDRWMHGWTSKCKRQDDVNAEHTQTLYGANFLSHGILLLTRLVHICVLSKNAKLDSFFVLFRKDYFCQYYPAMWPWRWKQTLQASQWTNSSTKFTYRNMKMSGKILHSDT